MGRATRIKNELVVLPEATLRQVQHVPHPLEDEFLHDQDFNCSEGLLSCHSVQELVDLVIGRSNRQS